MFVSPGPAWDQERMDSQETLMEEEINEGTSGLERWSLLPQRRELVSVVYSSSCSPWKVLGQRLQGE